MVESKSWDWTKNTDTKWLKPAPEAYCLSERWKEMGFKTILDLGCGLGRHALFFAGRGFQVDAIDLSDDAVQHVRDWAARQRLDIKTQKCDMLHLPFEDGGFDGVVAYNVIYHTDTQGFCATLGELTRVLRSGGELFITLISKNSFSYLNAALTSLIDENTILRNESDTERDVPHFFVSSADIGAYFSGYTLLEPLVEQRVYDTDRSSSHFMLHAVKI